MAAAIGATTDGRGFAAVLAVMNPLKINAALFARTHGPGVAGQFTLINRSNRGRSLYARTNGTGTVFQVTHAGSPCTSTPTACNLAGFSSGSIYPIW